MSITVTLPTDILDKKLKDLVDDETMLQVHNLFAKMCDPYVPMDEGILAQSLDITSEGVTYKQPYAHYQYTGLVYGPNIPIMENGIIVGWFSRPGQTKTPTGEYLNYSKEKHPLASSEWDKAMMRDKGNEFKQQVLEILKEKARKL